jgi:hypothetical protein
MIALALLYIVIIALLIVIVWLFQSYFETYSSLNKNYLVTDLENNSREQNVKKSCKEISVEINNVIIERLNEMEKRLPDLKTQENLPHNELYLLTINLKRLLHSSLNLLKVDLYNNEH